MSANFFLSIFFVAAALLHGISGLGFPMIITAVLSLSMPLKEAVIWALFPTLFVNFMTILWSQNIFVYVKKFWLLALSSFAGSLVGVKILLLVEQNILRIILAAMILFYVVLSLYSDFTKRNKKQIKKNKKLSASTFHLIFFGLLAGSIGGATNAMSPILMMFLLSHSDNQNEITAAANLSFLVGKLAQLFGLYHVIKFTNNEIFLVGGLTLLSLLFLYVGTKIRKYISVRIFRFIVLLFLFVVSLTMVFKVIGS